MTEHASSTHIAIVDNSVRSDRRLVAFIEPGARDDRGAAHTVARAAAEGADQVADCAGRAQYADYIRRMDFLALLCVLRAFQRAGLFQHPRDAHSLEQIIAKTQAPPRRHRTVRRWVAALAEHGLLIEDEVDRYRADRHVELSAVAAGWAEVDSLVMRLDPGRAGAHDFFKARTGNLAEVLRSERADAVQHLFPDGRAGVAEPFSTVTVVNRWANAALTAAVVTVARSASKPFRVLEVGAGAGGTGMEVIPALAEFDVEYTFTERSQLFLTKAKETFGEFPWVSYATLDITADFRAQGFSPDSFDAIIAGDVFRATRRVGRSLEALRELAAPGGWLLLAEMTRDPCQIMASTALLTDDGEDEDSRIGRDQDRLGLLGDELVFALPEENDLFARTGLSVYGLRVKTDRVPL